MDRQGCQATLLKPCAEGLASSEILNQALIAPMKEIGDRFEQGEIYEPEMLISAWAMQSGLNMPKPY